MDTTWTDFLEAPPAAGHAAQVYANADELAESVAAYLAAGFASGAPAVLISTPEHQARFSAALRRSSWDVDALQAAGVLTVLDAERTLEVLMGDDGPSAVAFEEVVGGVLDRVARRCPGQSIRAFGEMVDLLSRRGQLDHAIALEDLWNALALTRRFSLLCAYELDVFAAATQREPLPHVCRVHTHVLPAPDPERLGRAVAAALDEVLGYERAGQVYALVTQEARDEQVPLAQRVLMWISSNIPISADRVLARARSHYAEAPVNAGFAG